MKGGDCLAVCPSARDCPCVWVCACGGLCFHDDRHTMFQPLLLLDSNTYETLHFLFTAVYVSLMIMGVTDGGRPPAEAMR